MARHLTDGGDNESVAVLRGTVADLHDAVDDAKRFNRVYALRHFIIAPQLAMDRAQFERAAQALGDEFGFDPALALVVEHQKARAVEGAADRHWHLVVPETDAATGRVLSSRFDHARHEKIARLLEMEFAHPIVPGAHDVAVLAALRNEGHDDLADRLAGALGHGPKPASAYTSDGHQAAKRQGIDLATVRQHVRAAWAASRGGDDFRARLAGHGIDLAPGEKPGVVVIRDSATGMVLGLPIGSPVPAAATSTLSSKGRIMTATNPQTAQSSAQMILADTSILKRDLTTILDLARATALPMEGESMSVIEAMLGLLQTLVQRVEELSRGMEAVHQKLDEPGIAQALRRMMDAD